MNNNTGQRQDMSQDKIQNAGICIFKDGYARDRGAVVNNGALTFESDGPYFSKPADVHACCGVSFAIRKSLFTQLNGFPTTYFLYYEDVDLSLRVRLAGFRCVYVPKAVLWHHHGGSTQAASTHFLFYTERAQLLFVTTFFPFWTVISCLTRYSAMTAKSLVLGLHSSMWRAKAKIRLSVLLSYIKRSPQLLVQRRHIPQSTFRSLYETFY